VTKFRVGERAKAKLKYLLQKNSNVLLSFIFNHKFNYNFNHKHF